MKIVTPLILAACLVACTSTKPSPSADIATASVSDSSPLVPAIEIPGLLDGQIPTGTIELTRFNVAKLTELQRAVPALRDAALDSRLLELLAARLIGKRVRPETLSAVDVEADVWWMLVAEPDADTRAWLDDGTPFRGRTATSELTVRAFLPTTSPDELATTIREACAKKGCPIIATEVHGQYLRVDAMMRFAGLRRPEDGPRLDGTAGFLRAPTAPLRAFFTPELSYAEYRRADGVRTDSLLTELSFAHGGGFWGKQFRKAEVQNPMAGFNIDRDEFAEYSLSIRVDGDVPTIDVVQTYTPQGREAAKAIDVDVELPTIVVNDPVVDVEWAADFAAVPGKTDGVFPNGSRLLSNWTPWLLSPLLLTARNRQGFWPLNYSTPLFSAPLTALRIRMGLGSDGEPEGVALMLMKPAKDDKEKQALSIAIQMVSAKFGASKMKADEVRPLGDSELHVLVWGEKPAAELLGAPSKVSTSPKGYADLSHFRFMSIGLMNMTSRLGATPEIAERKIVAFERRNYPSGATFRATYGDARDVAEVAWTDAELPPADKPCRRTLVNDSQRRYLTFLNERGDYERARAILSDAVAAVAGEKCLPTTVEDGWRQLQSDHEAGTFATAGVGMAELCGIADRCPKDRIKGQLAAGYIRCFMDAYGRARPVELLGFAEKMPPEQRRRFLLDEAKKDGVADCPVIDVFAPVP